MRWVKGLARKANPANFEVALMKMNRTRFESMKMRKSILLARMTAKSRADRDNDAKCRESFQSCIAVNHAPIIISKISNIQGARVKV